MTARRLKSSLASNFEIVAWGTTTLSSELIDPTHIGVKYKTLMGNQPRNFGNVISVWSGGQIGWANNPKPVVTVPVCGDTPQGDTIITLPQDSRPPYMVAYGTSNSGTAYCAGQAATPGDPQPITTKLSLLWVENDSVLTSFTTPQGNRPQSYGNWIGLWAGQGFTYDGVNRIKRVTVNNDVAEGSQAMTGLKLTIDSLYTVGYACGPRDEDVAAWITFKTEPFLLLRLLRALFQGKWRDLA